MLNVYIYIHIYLHLIFKRFNICIGLARKRWWPHERILLVDCNSARPWWCNGHLRLLLWHGDLDFLVLETKKTKLRMMTFHKTSCLLHSNIMLYCLLKLQAHISTDFNSNQPKSIYLRYPTIYYTLSAKKVEAYISLKCFITSCSIRPCPLRHNVHLAISHVWFRRLQAFLCRFHLSDFSSQTRRPKECSSATTSNPWRSCRHGSYQLYLSRSCFLGWWMLGCIVLQLSAFPRGVATHCEDFGWSHWRGHKIWTLTCPTVLQLR